MTAPKQKQAQTTEVLKDSEKQEVTNDATVIETLSVKPKSTQTLADGTVVTHN